MFLSLGWICSDILAKIWSVQQFLGNDILVSEIASWTARSRNFPNESSALLKLLGVLFESQKLQIYPFRKCKGLLLPCCESFKWCFRGWKSIRKCEVSYSEHSISQALDLRSINHFRIAWHFLINIRWFELARILRYHNCYKKYQTSGHLMFLTPWPVTAHIATAHLF